MKVASKIVFLVRDPEGFGAAVADALHPNPNFTLRRLEEDFELSLEHYGIKDHKARGKVVHFVDDRGIYQVSVLLLHSYEPPTLVCAMNEVLAKFAGETSSSMPTIVAPFVVASSKLKCERRSLTTDSRKVSLYGVQIGPATDITTALAAKTHRPPLSLQIYDEPLSCFLQLIRVLKLPAIVLIGQRSRCHSDKALGEELQVLCQIGELLSSSTCLGFSRDKITWSPTKTSKDAEEPWRALYG